MVCQAMSERAHHHRQIDEHVSGQGCLRRRRSAVREVLWQGDCAQWAGFADVDAAACRISIPTFKQNREPLAGEWMEWMSDDQRIKAGAVCGRSMRRPSESRVAVRRLPVWES